MNISGVGEMGVGETGVGEMGQIIGETGVGEMGVGETGISQQNSPRWDAALCAAVCLCPTKGTPGLNELRQLFLVALSSTVRAVFMRERERERERENHWSYVKGTRERQHVLSEPRREKTCFQGFRPGPTQTPTENG